MRPLWTYAALQEAMGARPVGAEPQLVSGISIDSRTAEPGEAFFAIQGDRFDGHDFVTMALARGAATAVVSEDKLAALGRIIWTAAYLGLGIAGAILAGVLFQMIA